MAMSKNKNDAVLTALGHKTRREILRLLENATNGGLSPKDLSSELDEQLGSVSYHVRILAASGVLKLVTTKPRRGAIEHYYTRAGNAVDKKVTEVLGLIGKD
jgi:DNA-binding transcriptional ArsR family regulator